MADIILVVGGSRSGKSVFAESKVHELEKKLKYPVTYVATGTIWDEEFAKRVAKHRQRRPVEWATIEEPCNLHEVIKNKAEIPEIFLVDGMGTWVTNIMYKNYPEDFSWDDTKEKEFLNYLDLFINACNEFNGKIILVADEVGMDVVPERKQTRVFRDLNGIANQRIAQKASEVYLVICGIPVQIK